MHIYPPPRFARERVRCSSGLLPPHPSPNYMVRLDALVGEVLGIRKRAAEQLVRAGEVSVAGVVLRLPHWQVVLGEEIENDLPYNDYYAYTTQRSRVLLGPAAWLVVASRGVAQPHV